MEQSQPPRHEPSDPHLPWLVKASGRILGPYTRQEVIEKLGSKEFVLLDEIAQPLQRWRYVRDEAQFARVVEELRRGVYSGREDTMTATATVVTRSVTGEFDGSETVTEGSAGPQIEISEANETPEKSKASIKPEGPPSKAFGRRRDLVSTKKSRPRSRPLWVASAILVAIVLMVIAVGYHNQQLGRQREANFDSLIQQGVDAKRLGDYAKAMDFLKRAQQIRPDEAEINFILAPMLIAFEGQTVTGKRMLQHALLLKYRPAEVAQAKTAIGLASLIDGNLDESKQTFAEALEAQKSFYPALADMGILQDMRGDFEGAQDYFAQALKENPQDNSLVLLMNQAQIQNIEKKQKGPNDLGEIVKDLTTAASENTDYRQEAYLLAAYASSIDASENVDKLIDQALDVDPHLTDDHVHELLVYRKPVSWEALVPLCQKMQGSDPSPRRQTLLAYCYFKSGNQLEARRLIEMAIRKSPEDALLKAHYSLILKETGQDSEARAALNGIVENQKIHLPRLAEARICESQADYVCAETAYQKILQDNPSAIEAMAGLAHVAIQRNDYVQASQLVVQGLQISPTYAPLLQLQWYINEHAVTK